MAGRDPGVGALGARWGLAPGQASAGERELGLPCSLGAGPAPGVEHATAWEPFPPGALAGHASEVAPRLLGAILAVEVPGAPPAPRSSPLVAARIVEVEAYGGSDDPASHAARGRTRTNGSMFAGAGRLYVYRSYGVHRCANVVTGQEGTAAAVLVRAVSPLLGAASMLARRGPAGLAHLADGPGRVCQALGIGLEDDGCDLSGEGRIHLLRGWPASPSSVRQGTRIGITKAADLLWRWWDERAEPGAGRRAVDTDPRSG